MLPLCVQRDIGGHTHLSPITFNPIVGMSPFITTGSNSRGSCSSPMRWAAKNNITAIMSCENRKNNGTSEVFSTHLLLVKGALGQHAVRSKQWKHTLRPSAEVRQSYSNTLQRRNIPKEQQTGRTELCPSVASSVLVSTRETEL